MQEKIFQIKADLFKALAHPSRVKILEFLREGEKCVCEFTESLDLEQSNVSQHLAILKRQDLITSRKEGLKVIYSVTHPEIFKVLDLIGEIIVLQAENTVSLLHKLAENKPK
ncbi:ArsR/SmtB family transcription factor [Zhaonella formicivorans]|jgi:ArsR family transcriptional regulator|uniref:ArsR/SmtB family transcription factor n=1 Tax=Zhaonella formicivorans TaxID=2528593 RepID=UPI0010D6D8CB|nr:metalloregulator ArsR/SmtB family transcription factor [Zhaonella formicivorans]